MKLDSNRKLLAAARASGDEVSEVRVLQAGHTTRIEARAKEFAFPRRPIVSSDDAFFLVLAPLLFFAATFIPSRGWPKAAQIIQKVADLMRRPAGADRLNDAAALMKIDASSLHDWITGSRVGRMEHLIHSFRVLLSRSWIPDTEIEGADEIDAALERGKGVVLWVSHFCFSSLFTKMAFARAGYAVSHISRPEHGVSKSRFGIAVLNKIRSSAEDRFLFDRFVHDRNRPSSVILRALATLRGNGIVSVTVGAWEGRHCAIGPLLGGEYKVALGAPVLAFKSGAALLPVFTTRTANNTYRTLVGSPLGEAARGSLESFLLAASEELLYRHGSMVLVHPDQWRGWKDWLVESRLTGKGDASFRMF